MAAAHIAAKVARSARRVPIATTAGAPADDADIVLEAKFRAGDRIFDVWVSSNASDEAVFAGPEVVSALVYPIEKVDTDRLMLSLLVRALGLAPRHRQSRIAAAYLGIARRRLPPASPTADSEFEGRAVEAAFRSILARQTRTAAERTRAAEALDSLMCERRPDRPSTESRALARAAAAAALADAHASGQPERLYRGLDAAGLAGADRLAAEIHRWLAVLEWDPDHLAHARRHAELAVGASVAAAPPNEARRDRLQLAKVLLQEGVMQAGRAGLLRAGHAFRALMDSGDDDVGGDAAIGLGEALLTLARREASEERAAEAAAVFEAVAARARAQDGASGAAAALGSAHAMALQLRLRGVGLDAAVAALVEARRRSIAAGEAADTASGLEIARCRAAIAAASGADADLARAAADFAGLADGGDASSEDRLGWHLAAAEIEVARVRRRPDRDPAEAALLRVAALAERVRRSSMAVLVARAEALLGDALAAVAERDPVEGARRAGEAVASFGRARALIDATVQPRGADRLGWGESEARALASALGPAAATSRSVTPPRPLEPPDEAGRRRLADANRMADLAVEGVDADRVALARGALLGTYDACDGRGAGAEAAWESLVRLERLA